MRRIVLGFTFLWSLLAVATASAQVVIQTAPLSAPATTVQLYTLDGGNLYFKSFNILSDTGEYNGQSGNLADPCYLIHHGKDWLLWDTGLGDKIASEPNGETKFGLLFTVHRTLASQLAQIGLKPDDVHYVALSHLHPDHIGNIGLFPKATFIVSKMELTWALSEPIPETVQRSLVVPLTHLHVDTSEDDHDVYGDGTVQILRAPGHTPGHRFLLVKLAKSGYLLISGDLYHRREDYEKGFIPAGNTGRADTLASFARFARIRDNTHARVIIQHAPEDFAAMPAFPKFLD